MITVEDKIRTFSNFVYEKEVKNTNQRIQELEEKNKKVLETKQKELEDKCISLNKKMNKKIELETQKIISAAKLEAKDKVLNTKKDVLQRFMDEILVYMGNYAKSEAYSTYFYKLLDQSQDFLQDEDTIVYLTKKDIAKFKDEIKKKYKNIQIQEMTQENIGGMIIESISANKRIDLTLRRKVNDWKNEIGIRLYEALEK